MLPVESWSKGRQLMQSFKQHVKEDTGMRIIDLLPKKVKRMIYRHEHQDKYKAALLMVKALRRDPDVISRGLSKEKIQDIAADHFNLSHKEFAKVLDRKTRYERTMTEPYRLKDAEYFSSNNFINEADTSGATNTEMAICYAYNINQGMDHETALKEAGIPETKWATAIKKDVSIVKTGQNVADEMGNRGPALVHSGSGTASNYYAAGKDKTPKADFTGNSDNYISLKQAGDTGSGAQLMSAKSGEATGVFEAAIAHFENNTKVDLSNDKDFKTALKILSIDMEKTARNDLNVEVAKSKNDFQTWYLQHRKNDAVFKGQSAKAIENHLKAELSIIGATRGTAKAELKIIKGIKPIDQSQLTKYMDEYKNDETYKVGDVLVSAKHLKSVADGDLADPKLKQQITDIVQTSVDAGPWKTHLTKFFNNNEELKKWIVYEAASGLYKFTGKISSGQRYKGSESAVANKILVFNTGGIKEEHNVIDYAMSHPELVNNIDISYKGSGRSKYIKFGINASVEYSMPMLTEELSQLQSQYILNEGIFANIINKAKNFARKLTQIFKNFYENIIKKFVQGLYDLAKQGLATFMDELGIVVNGQTSLNTPSW